jgi:hypothetical protein
MNPCRFAATINRTGELNLPGFQVSPRWRLRSERRYATWVVSLQIGSPSIQGVDHNVVIVRARQSGLATALALRRAGIGGVSLFERADAAGTGTWQAKARMRTLRTSKQIPGPELGISALSFPAWFEAQHGETAFAEIDPIPLKD